MNAETTPNGIYWRETAEFRQASEHLQQGEWETAVAVLTRLAADYPAERALKALLTETQLRLDTERFQTTRRRHFKMPDHRLSLAVVLVGVLVSLAWLAMNFYNDFVTPSVAAADAAQQQEAVAGQAQQALAAGDYERALEVYRQLAALNPQHPALQGVAEAKQAKWLDEQYALAADALAADRLADAQAILIAIRESSPTYRDVNSLITKIEKRQRLVGLVRDANEAFLAEDWYSAVSTLEEARSIAPAESRDSIEADLFEAYLALGIQLIEASDGKPSEIQVAVDRFNRALALRPQEARATTHRAHARRYLNGYAGFGSGRWDEAVDQLEPLYREQPQYLRGKAVQLLYDAYLRSADRLVQQEEGELAWQRYYAASQLQGVDTSIAQTLADKLAPELPPTPAPTATPTAAPVPTAAQAGSTPSAAPMTSASAQPLPPSAPLQAHKNKIAFISTRGGAPEVWVMDPDGRNAFRPEDQTAEHSAYDRLAQLDAVSPDGQRSVTPAQGDGESHRQIYMTASDGGITKLTRMWGATSDPAWSPTGHWIAFVCNEPGNDEVFVIGAGGDSLNRLTRNQWEWDRHPSWSPDGKELVFGSNRETGHGQIWRMEDDGSSPVNLSNNEYEESDPVWIK
jgi:TolB protein